MIKNSFLILVVFIIVNFVELFAQTDLVKWYRVENYLLDDYVLQNLISENPDDLNEESHRFADLIVTVYKNTISDFDGDNCRFNPSCSEFFAEATKLTNPISSVLLFFDRLSRDTNFFSNEGYKTLNNRFYDPPSDYLVYETEPNKN